MSCRRFIYPVAIAVTTAMWCLIYFVTPFGPVLGALHGDWAFPVAIALTSIAIAISIRGFLSRATETKALLFAPLWLLAGLGVAYPAGVIIASIRDQSHLGASEVLGVLFEGPIIGITYGLLLGWFVVIPVAIVTTSILWRAAQSSSGTTRNEPAPCA